MLLLRMLSFVLLPAFDSFEFFGLDFSSLLDHLGYMSVAMDPLDLWHV